MITETIVEGMNRNYVLMTDLDTLTLNEGEDMHNFNDYESSDFRSREPKTVLIERRHVPKNNDHAQVASYKSLGGQFSHYNNQTAIQRQLRFAGARI